MGATYRGHSERPSVSNSPMLRAESANNLINTSKKEDLTRRAKGAPGPSCSVVIPNNKLRFSCTLRIYQEEVHSELPVVQQEVIVNPSFGLPSLPPCRPDRKGSGCIRDVLPVTRWPPNSPCMQRCPCLIKSQVVRHTIESKFLRIRKYLRVPSNAQYCEMTMTVRLRLITFGNRSSSARTLLLTSREVEVDKLNNLSA